MFWFSWPLFFLLRLPSLFEPDWYGDEGVYLSLGQGINRGLTLYSQIHDNKPPLLYYLAALSRTVFGFRLLLLLWMIPTVYVFYLLSKKFLSPFLARISTLVFIILSSIPLIEGNIANAEIFMLLPTLTALLIFPSRLFLSGLLLGLAFTFKVPVAVEFAFLFLWFFLLLKRPKPFKNLVIFCLAFVLPISTFYLYFLSLGAGPQFLFAALFQNFGYLGSWATGSMQTSVASGGVFWRLMALIVLWVILFVLSRRRRLDQKTFFLSAWFAATLFGALLSGRPYPHYLIQLLPPLILLLLSFRRHLYLLLLLCGLLAISLLKYKFYFYRTFPYYLNFISYVFQKKSTFQYRQYFGANVNYIYELADLIKSKTHPDSTIFIWGDEPYLYPLSDRLPAAKYVVAYHVVDFQAYDQVGQQLIVNQPQAIIYNSAMTNRPFPQLDFLVKNYYYLDDQIGPYYFFLARP